SRFATTYYHQYGPGGRVMEFFNWFKDDALKFEDAMYKSRKAVVDKFSSGGKADPRWLDAWMKTKVDYNLYTSDSRIVPSLAGLGAGGPGAAALGVWSEPPYATIGLGTGTMASYARPFQHVHFYEIDRYIREFSLPPEGVRTYFSYLKEARERSANVQVLMGDARLRMGLPYGPYNDAAEVAGEGKAGGPDGFYHMMVVDAFSSDAIPVHLLTKESMEMYFSKLAPRGVLCVHTSNRHLHLAPVTANVAKHIEMEDPDQTEFWVTVEEGSAKGQKWMLTKDKTTIGKDKKSDWVLEDADGEHARITKSDDWFYVEDAGSKAGTFVNGIKAL